MSSIKEEADLKNQLIEEVSRVQSSNLKRVESSSGMKTIFSSADYIGKLTQPKALARHGHHTPHSPGKNRIKLKHHEHKAISADLFENHSFDKKHVEEKKAEELKPDNFTSDPLATSTLRPETSMQKQNTPFHSKLEVNEGHDYTSFSKIKSESEHQQKTSVDGDGNHHFRNDENMNIAVDRSMAGGHLKKMDSSCDRDEDEMALPDTSIHRPDSMVPTEFAMTEEDHAIQSLLDLAEEKKAEMNESGINLTYGSQFPVSLSNETDVSQEFQVYSNEEKNSLRQASGRRLLRGDLADKEYTSAEKNMDDSNSYFDLKDIVSSTPQTGSMYEDTPSDNGSVGSDTGRQYNTVENTIDTSIEMDSKPIPAIHSSVTSEDMKIQAVNNELNFKANMGVYTQSETYSTDVPGGHSHRSSGGNSDERDDSVSEQPSQQDIEETHKEFDAILADLSTSIEEDFTMSEKIVGNELSSEADVIVHSGETRGNPQNNEAEYAQEFAQLINGQITTGQTSEYNSSSDSQNMEVNHQQDNVQEVSVLEHSILHLSADAQSPQTDDLKDSLPDHHTSEDSSLIETPLNDQLITSNINSPLVDQEDNPSAAGQMDTSSHMKRSDMSVSSNRDNGEIDFKNENLHSDNRGSDVDSNYEYHEGVYTEAYGTDRIPGTPTQSISESETSRVYETIDHKTEPIAGNINLTHSQDQIVNKELSTGNSSFREQLEKSEIQTENPSTNINTTESQSSSSTHTKKSSENMLPSQITVLEEENNNTSFSERVQRCETETNNTSFSEQVQTETVQPIAKTNDETNSSSKLPVNQSGKIQHSSVIKQSSTTTKALNNKDNQPPIAGSFLSKLKSGKSKSDFQTLSETVNVKSLAKSLEKSLNFSKMLGQQQTTEQDEETSVSMKPHMKLKPATDGNPKAAFGLVLNEIFQKNKQITTDEESEEEKPYRVYRLRSVSPPAVSPLTNPATEKQITEENVTAERTVFETQETPTPKLSNEVVMEQREKQYKGRYVNAIHKADDTINVSKHDSNRIEEGFENSLSSNINSNTSYGHDNITTTEFEPSETLAQSSEHGESSSNEMSTSEIGSDQHIETQADSHNYNDYHYDGTSDSHDNDNYYNKSDPNNLDNSQNRENIENRDFKITHTYNDNNASHGNHGYNYKSDSDWRMKSSHIYHNDSHDNHDYSLDKSTNNESLTRHSEYQNDEDNNLRITHTYNSSSTHDTDGAELQPSENNKSKLYEGINYHTSDQTDHTKQYLSNITNSYDGINMMHQSLSRSLSHDSQNNSVVSDHDDSFVSITTLQDNDDNLSDLANLDDTHRSDIETTVLYGQRNASNYDSRRDLSPNSSFSDETYTSAHEEFLVPNYQPAEKDVPVDAVRKDSAYPSYRDIYLGPNSQDTNITTTNHSQKSTKTFQRESLDANVSAGLGGHFDSSFGPGAIKETRLTPASQSNTWAFQQTQPEIPEADRDCFTSIDTVQGSSASLSLNTTRRDDNIFSPPSGHSDKPAEQLHGFNINTIRKEDSSDHVTHLSSRQPVYTESDVTTEWNKSEEFVTSSEKLSEKESRVNLTSNLRPRKYEKSVNSGGHSLFYDDSVDDTLVDSGHTSLTQRHISAGNKYKKGSMAYLLTEKEHVSADHNRSGRSTPQRKDLYVEEHILVSPTGVDERRGSHTSRDYLTDNPGEQEYFHFDMNSPGNYDREGTEGRTETIQHIERHENDYVHNAPVHLEPLPDTYIGTGKSQERSNVKRQDRYPVEVSQSSSSAYIHERKGVNDYIDGPSRSQRTEKVSSYSSQNGPTNSRSNHNGPSQQSTVIKLQTNPTGPETSRRERRHVEVTSHSGLGKPSGDDNISISSLSSHSSTSNKANDQHHRIDNRSLYLDNNQQPVTVSYISSDGQRRTADDSMLNHVKTTQNNRIYQNGKTDKRRHPRQENNDGSSQDVRYLIKSLEKDTKQPRRPIPGMVGDAFSYHVTSSGNENKSQSRNNHVNEVDVTTREAMRDRENKGQSSSHVIRRYKEERVVEDVNPNSSMHISAEPRQPNRNNKIIIENGQTSDRPIVFHPPSSLDRSDSDRTYDRSQTSKRQEKVSSGETTVYVDGSRSHPGRNKSDKIRLVGKEKRHHKGHSVSSDDNSSDDESSKRGHPKSGKVSTVLYDFSSDHHPSLTNVVHVEGGKTLKTRDTSHSQDIYSTPRNTERPYRPRSSSESSMSDQGHKRGTVVNQSSSNQVHLVHDGNRSQPRNYKKENVFYEHYEVKRDNPMYQDSNNIVYVSPHNKSGTKTSNREIYVDSKSHSPSRHQLSSSFSSISPAGSPTPDDKHVTTVSFDDSFNRKRSASPVLTNSMYKPKTHIKKHRVVKTDEQIIRPTESDNELYVRGSKSSPYKVMVKGNKPRSDTDESFYSDSRTSGSHRSTINISKTGAVRRQPDPNVPAVMSIPLSKEPVAMTIPAVHETKYVTNKSEVMELRRSASMDSVRDMVDFPVHNQSFRSDKVVHLNTSSDRPTSPEMRTPKSPYVSTITILNRKVDVKEPEPTRVTETITSEDDRYHSQLNTVKEERVRVTKEVPREQRRSEKHTTYSTYEEYTDTDNYEYVPQTQRSVTTVRQERQIPIREENIRPLREDRAKAVRESLHDKFTKMSYEESREPQQIEEKSNSDLKVVRGQFVIRNSMDIDLEEGDSLGLDDNLNVFDNSFTMNKENPLYQSDPDLYSKFESETVEHREQRFRATRDGYPDGPYDEVDINTQQNVIFRKPFKPSHLHFQYDRNDLDVPYVEADFGDGFEDIIQNTRSAAVKASPNKKKQNLSQLLMSKLAQIDSKDITQHIDVEHHHEDIYGDIKFIHADGSKSDAMDTTNFDSVSEHIDLVLKDGKALITIKVTAERIIPVDHEFNVWRKNQAIVTRNIEIDLKANEQRRRLYEHVMETTPRKMISSSGSSRYGDSGEGVLSSRDTLKLFSRLLSVAEKDDKAVERDEVRYETKHRDRSDSLPSLSNADMLY